MRPDTSQVTRRGRGWLRRATALTAGVMLAAAGLTITLASPASALCVYPSVTGVSPDQGPTAGGTVVTITGQGLECAPLPITAVDFGSFPAASFTVNSNTSITATSPPQAAGTVDITVTDSNGYTTPTSSADQFTYVAQGTSTAVTSPVNPSLTGAQVTYTATVSPAPSGGTVGFTDNGSPITGCGAQPVNTSTGTATCTATPSTAGAHNIVAAYGGTTGFTASTSPVRTQLVTNNSCSSFAGCNLQGLNLTGAQLVNANLSGSNLQNANLTDADLAGANLSGTNPNGANLTGADLAGADLAGANLNNANLTGTDLAGADVAGANLGNVTWSNTTCPDHSNSNNDGGTCVGDL